MKLSLFALFSPPTGSGRRLLAFAVRHFSARQTSDGGRGTSKIGRQRSAGGYGTSIIDRQRSAGGCGTSMIDQQTSAGDFVDVIHRLAEV